MVEKWMVNIIDKVGFSCYDVWDIHEIVDLGDAYNLITGSGDLFLEKEYCLTTEKIISESLCIVTIEYNTDWLNVYMERMESLASSKVC